MIVSPDLLIDAETALSNLGGDVSEVRVRAVAAELRAIASRLESEMEGGEG